jgi:hypothetical protein
LPSIRQLSSSPTNEWAEEQRIFEQNWEVDMQPENVAALRNIRRHMPVKIRIVHPPGFTVRRSCTIRVSLHGHARWLQPGFGHIGQIIISRICLRICHSVYASCHAHWTTLLGGPQRGRPMWSRSVETYTFSLVGTTTFEPDSFSSKVLQFCGAPLRSVPEKPITIFILGSS